MRPRQSIFLILLAFTCISCQPAVRSPVGVSVPAPPQAVVPAPCRRAGGSVRKRGRQ